MNYPPFPILGGLTFGLTYHGVRATDPTPFANHLANLGHNADAEGYMKAWNFNYQNSGNLEALIVALESEQSDALNDPRYSYWLDWFSWYARKRYTKVTSMRSLL